MARILLKTTIPYVEDDWHIGRFSLLDAMLRDEGHEVVSHNRTSVDQPDTDLVDAAQGAYDQVWLFGVDTGDGLQEADVQAIEEFRRRGGGLLLSRDHQDLGSGFVQIDRVGGCQHFHNRNPETDESRRHCDDTVSTNISWPNYRSGCNGDAQSVEVLTPLHELMVSTHGQPIHSLPAHPHEGAVSAPEALGEAARVVARGRSIQTGAVFNLVVAIEAGEKSGGGRVVADSSFHHFCDCNWDPALGAPTFVNEPWGNEMVRDQQAHNDALAYVRNIARWLSN